MNIGEAAKQTGLSSKTIRYYEELRLIEPARNLNGYRIFSISDIRKLQFLARARSLGFSVEDCRALLALYQDRSRASADVKAMAEQHCHQIDEKIAELESMRDTLSNLIEKCSGDERPDCPILADLAGISND